MTEIASTRHGEATRTALWAGIAAIVLLVIGANAHLVYVAVRSQPSCVAHVRQGENKASSDGFSAAQSACLLPERAPQSGK
jgi:hypothetical protein